MKLDIRSDRMAPYDRALVREASVLMREGWRLRSPDILNEARHRLAALARLNPHKLDICTQAADAERALFREMKKEGLVRDALSFAPYIHEETCPWLSVRK
ncbi:MAG: hypothetical protein KGH69_04375 [Candidatus Micrarchaeota archaeon]|nr:hypothetical protein [Candidatus Micrarchaeota archaeon]